MERSKRDPLLALRAAVLTVDGTRVSALARDLSPDSRHWMVRLDGEAIGCVSVMKVRGYALRGMAVLPHHQRMGVGTFMLQHVTNEVGAMWCNAREAAVPFYEQHGWRAQGPRFEMATPGFYQRMTWAP
jgi:GNAT superfamily N-acetyltransferase